MNAEITEDICQDCERENPVWFAPNEWWNRVVPETIHFLCPNCFILRAQKKDFKNVSAWKVRPELKKEPNSSSSSHPEGTYIIPETDEVASKERQD